LAGLLGLVLTVFGYIMDRRVARPVMTQVFLVLGLVLSIPPTISFLVIVAMIAIVAAH